MDAETVEKYFLRIEYCGGKEANLDNLRKLQLCHVRSVPFENLNTHMGKPVVVGDLSVLIQKVLVDGRGGYCFELNHLFYELLRALGYDVSPHVSRVRWEVPADEVLGFTHMMLLVKLDGKTWLVDVGAGPIGCPAPLDVHSEEPVETPYSFHRIQKMDDHDFEFEQQLLDSHGVWKACYRFSTAFRSYRADWVLGSYFVSTHPDSFFSYKILLGCYTPNNERLVLYNTELTRRISSGVVEKRTVTNKDEFFALLRDSFGLPVHQLSDLKVPGAEWEAK